jgi:hypothetical protein
MFHLSEVGIVNNEVWINVNNIAAIEGMRSGDSAIRVIGVDRLLFISESAKDVLAAIKGDEE